MFVNQLECQHSCFAASHLPDKYSSVLLWVRRHVYIMHMSRAAVYNVYRLVQDWSFSGTSCWLAPSKTATSRITLLALNFVEPLSKTRQASVRNALFCMITLL